MSARCVGAIFALALLALGLFALAPAARAHPVGFGLLEVDLTDEGRTLDLHLATTARGGAEAIALSLPPGCAPRIREQVSADANSLDRTWRFRCDAAPAELALLDVPADLQIRASVRRDGESAATSLLHAGEPRLALTAPDMGVLAFVRLGVEHIATGFDHLLFVLALLLVVRLERERVLRRLLLAVTAFTLGHSVTLALATLADVRLPAAPVEASIALSVLLLAGELARASRESTPTLTQRAPALVALAFGLLHGFGFAGALSEVLEGRALLGPLLGFNVGVELGQLAFVLGVSAALALVARVRVPARWTTRARTSGVYVIGAVAAFWFVERTAALLRG